MILIFEFIEPLTAVFFRWGYYGIINSMGQGIKLLSVGMCNSQNGMGLYDSKLAKQH